jgi:hypothetical protein
MRFSTLYELMIHGFMVRKMNYFKILSPLISYQTFTRLLNKKKLYYENNSIYEKKWREKMDQWTRLYTFD